jgi:hypothetical protein
LYGESPYYYKAAPEWLYGPRLAAYTADASLRLFEDEGGRTPPGLTSLKYLTFRAFK